MSEKKTTESEVVQIVPKQQYPMTKANMVEPEPSNELSIARSIIPFDFDSNKATFLSYRACGFSPREAMKMTGVSGPSVSVWRKEDPKFKAIEDDLPNIRHKLSEEFLNLEFIRNYTMILKRDYQVIGKSISLGKDAEGIPEQLTKQEHDYLLKARSHYTPQQLEIIRSIAGDHRPGAMDFTKLVLEASKGADKVKLELERR